MILGIDEVGRGPWAGPLVVGAVVLGGVNIDGLTDSKKLTRKQRELLDIEIRQKALAVGLGWVDANLIDEIGLSKALVLATKQAMEQINVPYHEIIIDGLVNFLKDTNKGQYVTTMKKADLLVPCVSAASIIAKVARDNYMISQDKLFPGYGFKSHVGYGTIAHQSAIEKLGTTFIHRLSWAPLKKEKNIEKGKVTTKQIGNKTEDIAAEYLVRKGHKIIDRNWKTKLCEIDIISMKNNTLYFTEVKYRKKLNQGDGLEAITPTKLRQMKFATELYILSKKISNIDLRLTAISLSGQNPEVIDFVEI